MVTSQQRGAEPIYRTLFEHAPAGILVADAEGRCLDANPELCRMLGYSREELVVLHTSDTVVQNGVQHTDAALNRITFQHDSSQEVQFRRKPLPADVFEAKYLDQPASS